MEFVWIILVPLIIWVIITAAAKTPGNMLAETFSNLGTLTGKSEVEIVAAVGPWTSRTGMEDGKYCLQWIRASYHIALLFTAEGVCEGVSHESLVR